MFDHNKLHSTFKSDENRTNEKKLLCAFKKDYLHFNIARKKN